MSMVIEKRPKMSDENLFALFHNAERALSKEPNLAAESVIKAIEHEWKERLDRVSRRLGHCQLSRLIVL
jgi:hypothetical protein